MDFPESRMSFRQKLPELAARKPSNNGGVAEKEDNETVMVSVKGRKGGVEIV